MGDNKRWFKVWTSIIMDQDMMLLPMDDRGRWMTLGALTAHNGENGILKIKTSLLAHLLHVTDDVTILQEKIGVLPNVKISDCCNGSCTVTFKNWYKYQVDSSAERVAKHRQNVTMQEEKRREEKKKRVYRERKTPFTPPSIEEVTAYCLERKNFINPKKWLDHYQAKNWMIGKNKMTDWRAAVRTWEDGNTKPKTLQPRFNRDIEEEKRYKAELLKKEAEENAGKIG